MSACHWQPSAQPQTHSTARPFMTAATQQSGSDLTDYAGLSDFSIAEMEKFWLTFWDFGDTRAVKRGRWSCAMVIKCSGRRFFPMHSLTLLKTCYAGVMLAMRWCFGPKIRSNVGCRGKGYMGKFRAPHGNAGAGMLRVIALALCPICPKPLLRRWRPVPLGRFGHHVRPILVWLGWWIGLGKQPHGFCSCGWAYNGKAHDCLAQLGPILAALPSVEKLVVVPLVADVPDLKGLIRR